MEADKNFIVSVIIPAFNAEKYIERAVASALNINEVKEIIIVEDGSKDDTLKICKNIAANYPRVSLYQHPDKKNHGVAASRNLGVKKSTYNYVAFLDADDYYLPNRFETIKNEISKNPDIDGVYDAVGIAYENTNVNKSDDLYTMKEYVAPEDLFYKMSPIGNKGFFSIDGLTVKKSVFKNVGYFDEKLRICEDTFFFIKLSLHHKLYSGCIVKPTSIASRYEHSSLTENKKRVIKYTILMYKKTFRWIEKNIGDKEKTLVAIESFFSTMFYYWAYKEFKSYWIYGFRFYVLITFLISFPKYMNSMVVRKYCLLIRSKD